MDDVVELVVVALRGAFLIVGHDLVDKLLKLVGLRVQFMHRRPEFQIAIGLFQCRVAILVGTSFGILKSHLSTLAFPNTTFCMHSTIFTTD